MAKTIGFSLDAQAVSAYASLQSAGIDIDALVARCLIDEAHRLRGKAAMAAEQVGDEHPRLELEDVRGVPHQIDYVRPPR
jgi:hypothetical protein